MYVPLRLIQVSSLPESTRTRNGWLANFLFFELFKWFAMTVATVVLLSNNFECLFPDKQAILSLRLLLIL